MNTRFLGYLYIAATIFFTVYAQLILKFRLRNFGPMPKGFFDQLKFLFILFFDPAIFSGIIATGLASLAWMATLTKFELSYAFTFTSLIFVFVLLLSACLLDEPLSLAKMLGIGLIVIGTVVAAHGWRLYLPTAIMEESDVNAVNTTEPPLVEHVALHFCRHVEKRFSSSVVVLFVLVFFLQPFQSVALGI